MKAGTVPTKVLAPVIAPLLKQRFPDSGIQGLANRSGVDWKNIEGILTGAREGVEFNTADRILCALGSPMAWHSPELFDTYMSVDLSLARCALHSCDKLVHEQGLKGNRRLYCSVACNKLAYKVRNGTATGERRLKKNRCLRGHKMEGDNVLFNRLPDGTTRRQCRQCKRVTALKASRKYQQKKREERMARDIRDPKVLGTALLRESSGPLSRAYDENKSWLEKLPDWTGDGFMSANPAEHHSGTSQLGNERIKAQS